MPRVYFAWLGPHLEAHGLTVERQMFVPENAAAVLYYVRKPGDPPRIWTLAVRQRDQTVRHRDVLPILRELSGGRA